jgi:hypothetical protein
MYCVRDLKLSTAMKCISDFPEGENEPVRVNASKSKANCREGGWLAQDNKNLSEIAWSRLCPGLKFNVKSSIPKIGKFDSIKEIFDCATDSEFKPDCKKPQKRQQPHQQQKQPGELSQQDGKKRNFRPFIFE